MAERKIPALQYDNATKKKILEVATELFALKGFSAVSMRDIAKAVGIKMSSIYYYYEGKESLLHDVLAIFENRYRQYFDWLSTVNDQANSLEAMMDNLFNKEFLEMRDPLSCFGMSLILKEQHNYEAVRKYAFELIFEYSINRLQADLDKLAAKNIIPPSDTKTVAGLLMICVMGSNDMRLHEYQGANPPFARMQFLENIKSLLTSVLKQGVLPHDASQDASTHVPMGAYPLAGAAWRDTKTHS